MALTNQEQAALRSIITREGGIGNALDTIRQLSVADKKATALATLQPAISVTVSDWQALGAFCASFAGSGALVAVLQDIKTAATARDASRLGPLLIALYAAALDHLGM